MADAAATVTDGHLDAADEVLLTYNAPENCRSMRDLIALAIAEERGRAEAPLRKKMDEWCVDLGKERMAAEDELSKWKVAWARLLNKPYEVRIAELEAERFVADKEIAELHTKLRRYSELD